jgi:hypothetical protein
VKLSAFEDEATNSTAESCPSYQSVASASRRFHPHGALCIPERPLCRAVGPHMEPATEYLRFAEECRRLAPFAKTEQHRQVLEEMARAWEKLAKEAEQ